METNGTNWLNFLITLTKAENTPTMNPKTFGHMPGGTSSC